MQDEMGRWSKVVTEEGLYNYSFPYWEIFQTIILILKIQGISQLSSLDDKVDTKMYNLVTMFLQL